MKKIVLIIFVVILGIICLASFHRLYAQQSTTTITVNPTSIQGDVNKLVLGHNLFYQYVEETGMNPENIVKLLKESGASIVRFPGGLFADTFHWYNSIGPQDRRPMVCRDYSYGQYLFGMAEFLNITEAADAQVTYIVNEDTGTPAEAKGLIEFTNGILTQDIKTRAITEHWSVDAWRTNPTGMPAGYYTWLRTQDGYGKPKKPDGSINETPWNIKYWEIGNEIYAPWYPQNQDNHPECNNRGYTYPSPGRLNNTLSNGSANAGVSLYIDRLAQFADALRSIDPSVQIGAVGYNYCPGCPWNSAIINDPRISGKINFLTDHPYAPNATKPANLTQAEYDQAAIDSPYHERIHLLNDWKNILNGKKLAVTEHSAAFAEDSGDSAYDLRAALLNAGRLNDYILNPSVLMANFWHFRSPAMYWRYPQTKIGATGIVYKLYHDYLQQKLIQVSVAYSPTHNTKSVPPFLSAMVSVPDIDPLGSISSDGQTMSVFLLNRNIGRSIPIQLNLGAFQYVEMEKNTIMTTKQGNDALYANNNADQQVYADTQTSSSTSQTITDTLSAHTLVVYTFRKTALKQLTVRAKGSICNGAYPQMELWIDDHKVKTWDSIGSTYQDYIYSSQPASLVGTIKVAFPNDCYNPPEDRNLFVDYITLNGTKYESEYPATTGINIGLDPGTGKREIIFSNGYFQYDTSVCPGKALGNINCETSGLVNSTDYSLLLSAFGSSQSTADVNGDGKVDIFDLNILVTNFGK